MSHGQPPYELIDFGDGRKLERFGPYTIDRPCPAAEGQRRLKSQAWGEAQARYERLGRNRGRWVPAGALPEQWQIEIEGLVFGLQPSPFGHVGLFPEQLACWHWIDRKVRRAARPVKVLNLFAYTGGSTMAAARAGAEVVHVDAARNVVARARENARRSQLADAPVRWITEDVGRFTSREVRRGNHYHSIVLDPPSYGHGLRGETWKLPRDLEPLLDTCAQLIEGPPALLLLTCHTPGWSPARLRHVVSDQFARLGLRAGGRVEAGTLWIETSDRRRLNSGMFARWPP